MIDGVIKYSIEHETTTSPEFSNYNELEALRTRLFALGLIGELDGIGYGNLSMRAEEKKSFFITATQTGKQASLAREYYTYISDYDFKDFKVISQGLYKPSSEALSHAMIYEVHPDISSVIHIHSKPLWNYMKENNYLGTNAEYGTIKMVEEIASLYENKNPFDENIFVMKGHEDGVIIFGRSVEEAELTLYKTINSYINLSLF